ncbi:MAG: glycosyltransferase, partial [Chitinophagaceae bacterium]
YSNIRFEGRKQKDEVLDLMKKAKALIFPSIWYEGLPYTILEAFATGTPVIASRLGAMADMIKHNFNGYHFTAGDSADLQSSIELFESDDSSKTFYKQARETYLNKYHPDIHYKTIMEIYTNLILKPGNKG